MWLFLVGHVLYWGGLLCGIWTFDCAVALVLPPSSIAPFKTKLSCLEGRMRSWRSQGKKGQWVSDKAHVHTLTVLLKLSSVVNNINSTIFLGVYSRMAWASQLRCGKFPRVGGWPNSVVMSIQYQLKMSFPYHEVQGNQWTNKKHLQVNIVFLC